MKEAINYYYNLNINEIFENNQNSYFYINKQLYILNIFNENINNIKNIYEINNLVNNSLIQIISNKDNQIITFINNIPYILYRIYFNINKKISLKEIMYLSNIKIDYNNNITTKKEHWNILWSKKIDYLEYQINQIGKKYPLIVDSFSYFVGLTENAISYYQNTIIDVEKHYTDAPVISHKKIKEVDNLFYLFDPVNIILDHKSRDIAEYIKLSFFNNNTKIFDELRNYFSTNYYSNYAIRILIARLLYPSFYFDLYDDILTNKKKETDILKITSKINEYEQYLKTMLTFLKSFYHFPEIDWLN